ncbi:unnamed protein product [Parnassius apollo]|uniref:(apollo) hypothetical protein n=1 Tax=Parnassius apollo TaxID=110799 RepID=A0A8S3XSY9_PARAO|nr:unnamed protein product [Parnassius apollo]
MFDVQLTSQETKGKEMARQPHTACSALVPPRSPEAETLRVSVFRAGAKFRTASVGPAIRDAYAYVGCIAAAPGVSTAPPRGNARACPGASPLATRRARLEPSLLPIRYRNSKGKLSIQGELQAHDR